MRTIREDRREREDRRMNRKNKLRKSGEIDDDKKMRKKTIIVIDSGMRNVDTNLSQGELISTT